MAEDRFKKKVAKKLFVSDILSGTYVKRPGWEPSGILTRFGEIARVNLMGVVVSLTDDPDRKSFLIDDGTGNMSIRLYDDSVSKQEMALGDMVNVIGRPREAGSEKYVVPEIVRKVEDKAWHKLHRLEVKMQREESTIPLPVELDESEEKVYNQETGPYQKILNVIAIMDKGEGVDVQDIVKNVKVSGCDAIISSLLTEGEIFEISPGRVKVLD